MYRSRRRGRQPVFLRCIVRAAPGPGLVSEKPRSLPEIMATDKGNRLGVEHKPFICRPNLSTHSAFKWMKLQVSPGPGAARTMQDETSARSSRAKSRDLGSRGGGEIPRQARDDRLYGVGQKRTTCSGFT